MLSAERQLVVAAVARRDSRVLLCRRPLEKRHGGLWEFPGGKVHAGESPDAALARELDEELGLVLVRAGAPLAVFDDPGSSFTIAFHLVVVDGEPEAREHLDVRWVDLARVTGFELAPSDRRFVDGPFLEALR
jgi:8-oxo-dGTP diphosphatase